MVFFELFFCFIAPFILYTAILRMFEMYRRPEYDYHSNYERYIWYFFAFGFQLFWVYLLIDFYKGAWRQDLIMEINNKCVQTLLSLFGYIGVPILAFIYHLYCLEKDDKKRRIKEKIEKEYKS